MSKNYTIQQLGALAAFGNNGEGRTVLGDALGLTGAEVSVNLLPAGAAIPFLHSHTLNDELYIILTGNGTFIVDGETFTVTEGDFVNITPNGLRGIQAGTEDLRYVCIQVQAGSLAQKTETDGIISSEKVPF